jgi:hypothetical protein
VAEYFESLEKIEDIKQDIEGLILGHNAFKKGIDSSLSRLNDSEGEPKEFLSFKLHDRSNAFFSSYLDKIADLKKSFDAEVKKKDELFKSSRLLRGIVSNIEKATDLAQTREFKYKDRLKDSLGLRRCELPQIDQNNFMDILRDLQENVTVVEAEVPLTQLKPSQGEFDEEKIISMLANFDRPTIKYIVSQDGYIMDGHHDWASRLEEDETGIADVLMVGMSAQDLIDYLNATGVFHKVDIDDKEVKKSMVLLVKAYELGKISEDDFERVKAQIEKGIYKDNSENRRVGRVGRKYGGNGESKKNDKKDFLPKSSFEVAFGKVKLENGTSVPYEEFIKKYRGLLDYVIMRHKFFQGKTYLMNNKGQIFENLKTDKKKQVVMSRDMLEPVRIQLDSQVMQNIYEDEERKAKESLDATVAQEEQANERLQFQKDYEDYS